MLPVARVLGSPHSTNTPSRCTIEALPAATDRLSSTGPASSAASCRSPKSQVGDPVALPGARVRPCTQQKERGGRVRPRRPSEQARRALPRAPSASEHPPPLRNAGASGQDRRLVHAGEHRTQAGAAHSVAAGCPTAANAGWRHRRRARVPGRGLRVGVSLINALRWPK